MNYGYTKLFGTLVTSSIWTLPDPIRIVWITMLALADKGGVVHGSIPGLAQVAHVSLQDCENALKLFQEPDTYSRNKEKDGRRVEEVDGGWRIVSYDRFRDLMSTEARRDYLARKMREYRSRKREMDKLDKKRGRTIRI